MEREHSNNLDSFLREAEYAKKTAQEETFSSLRKCFKQGSIEFKIPFSTLLQIGNLRNKTSKSVEEALFRVYGITQESERVTIEKSYYDDELDFSSSDLIEIEVDDEDFSPSPEDNNCGDDNLNELKSFLANILSRGRQLSDSPVKDKEWEEEIIKILSIIDPLAELGEKMLESSEEDYDPEEDLDTLDNYQYYEDDSQDIISSLNSAKTVVERDIKTSEREKLLSSQITGIFQRQTSNNAISRPTLKTDELTKTQVFRRPIQIAKTGITDRKTSKRAFGLVKSMKGFSDKLLRAIKR